MLLSEKTGTIKFHVIIIVIIIKSIIETEKQQYEADNKDMWEKRIESIINSDHVNFESIDFGTKSDLYKRLGYEIIVINLFFI